MDRQNEPANLPEPDEDASRAAALPGAPRDEDYVRLERTRRTDPYEVDWLE
jgi:hypothetical protein